MVLTSYARAILKSLDKQILSKRKINNVYNNDNGDNDDNDNDNKTPH